MIPAYRPALMTARWGVCERPGMMMKRPHPIDLFTAGYRTPDPNSPAERKRRRRQADTAVRFRPDEHMERLLVLRTSDPPTFARIVDPLTRTALGHYAAEKQAAEEEGTDDDDDDAA